MNVIAQLITVYQNGRLSVAPHRNVFEIEDVTDANLIKEKIEANIAKLRQGGHVLVKFENQLFMCEKNNVDPEKPYVKHQIHYHPHAKHFTI